MPRLISLIAALLLASNPFVPAADPADAAKLIGGGCDACQLIFEGMPKRLDAETVIPRNGAEGEVLEIEGVIYQKDGKTPAPDVILYVYQTDTKGFYSPAPEQREAQRHGHLRGWMKTDQEGRYKFRTIRPASYPERDVPAHIHPIIKEPGKNEYYIDEYRFADDPLLTRQKRDAQEGRGGSGIVMLEKNAEGTWIGRRDIILGRNIPDYR